MIKDVIATGSFVQVIGGGGSFFPYINMSNISAGMVRWNGNTQNLEVYDGASWMTIASGVASVGLTSEAVSLLEWARTKRDEEAKLKALAEKHIGIKDLKEQLDIMVALVKENDETR